MEPGIRKHRLTIEYLKEAFAYHQMITDSSGKPVDYVFLEVNPAFEKMTGLLRDEILNKRVTAVLPELIDSSFDWIGTFGKVALTGETASFENYSEPLQRWYEVTAYSDAPGYFATLFRDITDQKERRRTEASLENSEARLNRVNKCLLDLGPDYQDNINKIVALCGELLGGACAIYNRLDRGMLCVWGQWQLPEDFKKQDRPEGHICFDLIKQVKGDMLYIPDLQQTSYLQTDPNVQQYDLKSYVGHLVRLAGEPVGSLCVVFQQHYSLSENDRNLLGIMARAIETEERRKQTEEVLQQSEARFQKMLALVPDMISIHDPQMNILYSNWNGFAAVPKEKRKLNTKCYQTYRGLDRICPDCKAINVLQTSEPYQAEVELPEGNWVDLRVLPILDQNSNVEMFVEWVRDITDRKKAEEALRRREEEFRALAENTPDVVARFDRYLRHIYVNSAIEKETGIPREQFIGKTHSEMGWLPETAKARAVVLQEVFDTALEKTHYFEYKTPVGWKYYHSRNVPEFAPDGTVETVLSISRDITAIKEMEAALYQEKLKTEQMHRRALPDYLPKMPGLTLAASYIPAASLQGDYCNVIRRRNQLLLYLVDADESRDDGVMQSLYVRKAIEDYLQAHAEDAPVSPAFLLRYLQDRFQQDHQAETTPLCVWIGAFENLPTAENADSYSPELLRYVSTGFCAPPLLIKESDNHGGFALENLYLAMDDGTELQEHTITVVPGSTFVFSTDGLFNQGRDRGSYELRLRELLHKQAHLPPELISLAVETDFTEFHSDNPLQNDLAFIVVQVPSREQCLSFKLESEFQQIGAAKDKVSSLLHQELEEDPNLLHFHELLVNAVEHGNKQDGAKKVAIDLTVTDRYYKAVITDQGEGFNWRDRINRELDLEGDSERGRGIIMTRMMTDYLGYNERGNRVTMINLLR